MTDCGVAVCGVAVCGVADCGVADWGVADWGVADWGVGVDRHPVKKLTTATIPTMVMFFIGVSFLCTALENSTARAGGCR